MVTHESIVGFGPVEEAAQAQLERCLSVATLDRASARGVLCADHHKGYSMPIGGVLASQSVVMPAGVGYDIACGNCAVRTDILAKDVDVARVMDEVFSVISFGVGLKNNERIADHPVFDTIAQSPIPAQRGLLELAKSQLGTVGSGNHYVDLFEDRADGALWIGVHFGSRGFGHKTACGFLALAEGKAWGDKTDDSMDAAPAAIRIDSGLGQAYLAAMEIAGEYAYAGRNWVVDRVRQILGAADTFRVHNHHNFAWREQHGGEPWLVVRKGATPAFPGQQGFVGGSMGDDAVIIEGVESTQSADALYSTVHGAGRVMGRMQAKGKWKRGECVRPGLVDWSAAQTRVRGQGVELRGAGADEAPECYKRLSDVLAYHGGTIKVLHTLRPIGVAMAGADVIDPFRD
jgi:tRNA-splicing ligase RtcB (3'-phosphate/5'-hydroxy nucleic acid ligase)